MQQKNLRTDLCFLKATRSLQNSLLLNAAVFQKERKVGF
jgi:hypothetical protein